MCDLLTIALEAHSEELNHHRRYEVSVGRDLLGDWVVTIRYGRVGVPLREMRFGSAEVEQARRIVHERLRRRLSAPRRIGCAYRLRATSNDLGQRFGLWVPAECVGHLLGSDYSLPGTA